MTLAAALLVALLIDRLWGEPPAAVHPVVGIGRYLQAVGRHLPLRAPAAFVAGTAAWCLGAAVVAALAFSLQFALLQWLPGWAGALLLGLALKPMLAWRMLRSEALAVEAALAASLDAGRARLSFLVSRRTADLTESEVRESAIESLAENLNDSVIAPIFWFVLLGLPGAAVYRFANTADAMWGYRSVRHGRDWEWAGKWAARADDVLSWMPARLTAALLALVAGGLPLRTLWREAGRTPSPNSGWPMAAMALALGVCLRKPGVYGLNAQGRAPVRTDTAAAVGFGGRAVWLGCAIALCTVLGMGS